MWPQHQPFLFLFLPRIHYSDWTIRRIKVVAEWKWGRRMVGIILIISGVIVFTCSKTQRRKKSRGSSRQLWSRGRVVAACFTTTVHSCICVCPCRWCWRSSSTAKRRGRAARTWCRGFCWVWWSTTDWRSPTASPSRGTLRKMTLMNVSVLLVGQCHFTF